MDNAKQGWSKVDLILCNMSDDDANADDRRDKVDQPCDMLPD